MSELTIDVTEVAALARDLRRANPVLSKEFLKGLGKAGDVVAQKAKENAAFSTRIPKTIKARRRGVQVRLQAGGPMAPHAAPLEHGGRSGTFRHPVFGNSETWVTQAAHPFLQPALEANVEPVEQQIIAAVDATFGEVGFNA